VAAVTAAVLVVLGSAGCGSDDGDALRGTPEDATATTTSSTVASTTTEAGEAGTTDDAALVELTTSGGLDGRGVGGLVVSPDGVMRHIGDARVAQGALAPDELDSLVALLDRTDFADIPAEPERGAPCADAYVYTVRYAEWTVSVDDCSVPDELAPVLDRLQDLLARFG
jgi:hypothetical protein